VVILYGVELSYATVLMSQSNLLLVESSSRGVVRLCWLVVMSLVIGVVWYYFFKYNRQLSSFLSKKNLRIKVR